MATITVNPNYGLDISALDFSELLYGDSYSRSSSRLVVDYGTGYRDVLTGSGLRYDAQTQGFHLQQPSVDDFTPANQGGRLDSRTRGLLNAWLSDYAQREPIYKLDPAVAGVLGALQVQSAQVKNGKLVVTFNQNLGNLVPAGLLGK